MTIAEGFLLEFKPEMDNTRKMLERVPDEGLDYRPHAKSMTMGRLAGHIAEMPGWGVNTIEFDELDLNPPGGSDFKPCIAESRDQVLEVFERGVAAATEAIKKTSDDSMRKPWTLKMGSKLIFTMPRIAVLKVMILSHMVHHRAQLSVYLRINDIPIPGMYGPSADEM